MCLDPYREFSLTKQRPIQVNNNFVPKIKLKIENKKLNIIFLTITGDYLYYICPTYI